MDVYRCNFTNVCLLLGHVQLEYGKDTTDCVEDTYLAETLAVEILGCLTTVVMGIIHDQNSSTKSQL